MFLHETFKTELEPHTTTIHVRIKCMSTTQGPGDALPSAANAILIAIAGAVPSTPGMVILATSPSRAITMMIFRTS